MTNNNQLIWLALTVDGDKTNEQMYSLRARDTLFQTFQPNMGAHSRFQPLDEVLRKGHKSTNMERIKDQWEHFYGNCNYRPFWLTIFKHKRGEFNCAFFVAFSAKYCSHVYLHGHCKNKLAGIDCTFGMRRRKYTVLSGSIFAVWNRIEHVLRQQEFYHSPKVIRLKTTDGSKVSRHQTWIFVVISRRTFLFYQFRRTLWLHQCIISNAIIGRWCFTPRRVCGRHYR